MECKLVTFMMLTYNQEHYIKEAFFGAINQSYDNLEIVISDDNSKDATFEILKELVGSYQGPHSIVLKKNSSNLGVIANIQAAISCSSGDIVVMAAGDDISESTRVIKTVKAFESNPAAFAVFSNILPIDRNGSVLNRDINVWIKGQEITFESIVRGAGGVGIGASYAYRRKCFDWPWKMPATLISEDKLLPIRAFILGGLVHIPEPLVKYRLTDNSLTTFLLSKGLRPGSRPDHLSELKKFIQFSYQEGFVDEKIVKRSLGILETLPLINKIEKLMDGYPIRLKNIIIRLVDNLLNWRTIPYRLLRKIIG